LTGTINLTQIIQEDHTDKKYNPTAQRYVKVSFESTLTEINSKVIKDNKLSGKDEIKSNRAHPKTNVYSTSIRFWKPFSVS
jgi:hypothetical protein